ncbi:proteasome inhibitor PI31 subunit [Cataglyphis hispanica]|uniref:proteasome inhibitor PI31 subunit n=1 Tax=Cataglyphis hispanica TaxID=1086592 RepID=UPI0021801E6D|nr:proteasome inhibitor PI31 subunit [Cataglyphis hispanica]
MACVVINLQANPLEHQMTDTNMFGFEALHKVHCKEINKKQDVIILLIHWYLTKCGFRCIGIGDEKAFDASQKGSELLPEGWNSQTSYTLRYIKDEKLYILLGIKSDMDLLLNLVRHHDDSISNIQFSIEETVISYSGLLETMIPSYHTILYNMQKDFIGAIYSGNTKEVATQTNSSNSHSFSIKLNENQRMRRPIISEHDPEHDPERVGVRDLNPFGQGGGMIFNPFPYRPARPSLGVPGRLPPGAIPPGARFDPLGPPDVEPLRPYARRPDDDHFPPPGFDMFD